VLRDRADEALARDDALRPFAEIALRPALCRVLRERRQDHTRADEELDVLRILERVVELRGRRDGKREVSVLHAVLASEAQQVVTDLVAPRVGERRHLLDHREHGVDLSPAVERDGEEH
jgi:hypothetical protein